MTRPTWKTCLQIASPLVFALAAWALICALPSRAQDTEHERKVLKKVEAQYPSILKKRGIGWTVRLKVSVKADGSVKDVEVLGGNPTLADAADKAVRQWKFAPGNDSTITIAVQFDPNS
jgi:TonB family protein